jgi:hypothetical protein
MENKDKIIDAIMDVILKHLPDAEVSRVMCKEIAELFEVKHK